MNIRLLYCALLTVIAALFFVSFCAQSEYRLAQFERYHAQNTLLKSAKPSGERVVFFGDSIIDGWPLASYFPGKSYINRGIAGQTTLQMLLRFNQDVIELHPQVLFFLGSSNDIGHPVIPISKEESKANYISMITMARAHNIRVIIASILPVHGYTRASTIYFPHRPMEKIRELNHWLEHYCLTSGDCIYIDYTKAMEDKNGFLQKRLSEDGLHPNSAGYKIMVPLTEAAIERVLPPLTPAPFSR